MITKVEPIPASGKRRRADSRDASRIRLRQSDAIMCGRYSLTTPVDGLRALFGFQEVPNLPPRYNIAPSQAVLAVARGDGLSDQGAAAGRPRARFFRWGLVPSWADDPAIGNKLINARAETARQKPSFRNAFRRRRCLLPADGFYEWHTESGVKQPYLIRFTDGEPFAFAGLWERWQAPDGSEVESCSILTTEAAPALAGLHHRMPVIVEAADFATWLGGWAEGANGAGEEDAAHLLRPYDGTRTLAFHPVDRRVNDVRNDDADLATPTDPSAEAAAPTNAEADGGADTGSLPPTDDKGQMSLF